MTAFAKEFEMLSKKYKFSDMRKSERYETEAKHYRSVNKKTTLSSLIWFLIEIVGIVVIYLVFVQKYFSLSLF